MVIVDTSVWIDYLNGAETAETTWLDRALAEQRLGILDLILCEILQGVSTEKDAPEVLRELRRLEVFQTGGRDLAILAARNYRSLRRRGKTVRKTIDCLIATFCRRHGHALLHDDADFEPFETYLGLRVIHPPAMS